MSNRWYELENVAEIDSPALIVYPDRIAENMRRMIAIAGSADRLRPHVKTHKMSAIVRMQIEMGIHKCKCATLAEAEMAAGAGASDVLLAHQPVGPKIAKLAALGTSISTNAVLGRCRRSANRRGDSQRPAATPSVRLICCSISMSAWAAVEFARARRPLNFIA